jgi:hypothetical protein
MRGDAFGSVVSGLGFAINLSLGNRPAADPIRRHSLQVRIVLCDAVAWR